MSTPSIDYITFICSLYNDVYDDRVEDTKPGGFDWIPGMEADHKSLAAFQKELTGTRQCHLASCSIYVP